MKCKIFYSSVPQYTVDKYNEWAEGKPLTKDVIVHTNMSDLHKDASIMYVITVFFDETLHPAW